MAYDARKEELIENDKKNGDKSQKRGGGDTQGQEDSDEYTKGLILSFTVKKVGAPDATDKPSEKADTENKVGATDEPAEDADTKIEVEAADANDESAEDADTEKADAENADGTDKAADTEEKLSREDIKDALTEYGIIRVGHPYYTPSVANCSYFM